MFLLQDCWWSGENVTSSCYRDTSFCKGSELFFQLRYYFDGFSLLKWTTIQGSDEQWGRLWFIVFGHLALGMRWLGVCLWRVLWDHRWACLVGSGIIDKGEKKIICLILYHGWDRTRLQLFVTQLNVTAALSTSNQTTKLQTKDGWFSCLRPMLLRDITTRIPIESNMDS